jgi:DNA ligase-associated metallophosphoesterase
MSEAQRISGGVSADNHGAVAEIPVNGVRLRADLSGAAYWPERRLLLVADLHLEKGSFYAERGRMLPPYDSRETLSRLASAAERLGAESVCCLGDSFHDGEAPNRLTAEDGRRLRDLVSLYDWIWVTGNHDPAPPQDWGGRVVPELTLGPLTFRHEARISAVGEVSGHFHPKAAVKVRGKRVSGRAFLSDGRRLILPAFGAYTGGLSSLDPAIASLFPKGFAAWILGKRGLYGYPSPSLVP